MPAKASTRPSSKSVADTRSTTTSSHASSLSSVASTRSPSPSPPPGPSTALTSAHQPALLYHSPDHLFADLRRRRNPSSSSTSPTSPAMFQSRKYSPLPTSSGPRKRAGGGAAGWKRWVVVGVAVIVLVGLGYSRIPHRSVAVEEEAWDAEHTYTPNLDDLDNYDENDYESPPFRPDTAKVGPDVDEEEDQEMHILPVGGTQNEDLSSPHDPESGAAHDAAEAEEDFSEVEGNTPPVQPSTAGTPMSFEEDEDASSTVVCAEPYDTTRPLVQYALTIDAGSTGSRIHVYKFHNCGPSPQLEYETFKMLNPGLSSFKRDPTAAAASLDPLIEEAKRVVPKDLWHCTPVEVKATAGLRLLGESESVAILDEVRNRLETESPFVVSGDKAVEIMDGKDEGVYAWITANYLLSKIGEGVTTADTLAVMDLGGASTQIVFEPKFKADADQQLVEGEHKYLLNFGGKEYTLYQHSYLGYGLMRARRSVHNLVAFTWSFGQSSVDWDELNEETRVPNPCLSAGTTRMVELDPPGRTAVNVTMHGANGGFEACNRVIELVMAKDA